jgi:hypothetical protein
LLLPCNVMAQLTTSSDIASEARVRSRTEDPIPFLKWYVASSGTETRNQSLFSIKITSSSAHFGSWTREFYKP